MDIINCKQITETTLGDSLSSAQCLWTGKNCQPKNKTKQKIKYVKRHNMTIDDITTEFTKRGIVRKTMVWFVTGHWRKYKSGKRIFIRGYWKGALRELKATIEPRERELIVNKV